ncbi:MAG: class I SAM-dependent methyltransferase [Bacteroidetes bacterium]|nr:class I SAM-dependent methyltransferase [Bacteroidota bacterium]
MPKWFESWFNSEYYHLLYNNRDEAEAVRFINNITNFLGLPTGSFVADIACGKGRHSRVLASLGYKVLGLDISPANIEYAKTLAGANEQYLVHDMRKPFPTGQLDAALNLFTSFGYFDDEADDLISLGNIYYALKPGGMFVQDYLNSAFTLSHLKPEEQIQRGGVTFNLLRYVKGGFVKKDIEIMDGEKSLHFQESVKIYTAEILKTLHENAGFRVLQTFGDYSLNPFDEKSSARIILVSQKV